MPLLDGLRKRLARFLTKGFSINWLGGASTSPVSTAAYQRAVGDGTECDVIMAPVLWAARRMAESPVGVQKTGDNAIDMMHPLAKLLKRPSPWFSGSAFRKAQTIEWMLDGNAYAYKIRGRYKEVLALQFLPHWAIRPHWPIPHSGSSAENEPTSGYIDWYDYYPWGITSAVGAKKLFPEDVVHLRNGIDPNFPLLGLSPLKILLREVYTDTEAAEFTAMLLRNAGVMGVVISPKDAGGSMLFPGEKPEDAKKRVQTQWAGTRRGEPMVAAGPLDVNYIGIDAAKLDLSRLRDVSEERVSALLGIPAAVVGFGAGLQQTKVGATMVEMRAMGYEDCIIPMMHEWADDWDTQLLPEFIANAEDYCLAWDLSKVRVLQDDENKRSERIMRQWTGSAITRGQALVALGYEATPDDDVYLMSSIAVLLPKTQAGASYEPPPESVATNARRIPALKATRASANVSRLMHRLEKDRKRQTAEWASRLAERFKEYGDTASKAFERIAAARGLKQGEPEWDRIAEQTASEIETLDLAYEQEYLNILRATFNAIDTIIPGLGVNLSAPVEARILSLGGVRKGLVDIAQQTKDAIFAAIEQGRTAGEGAAAIAGIIRDMVAAGPWGSAATRAMVIARTEAKYAQNISSLEAYKSSDTVTGVEVFDAQLGPTDLECEMRNGRVVTFEIGQQMVDNEHPQGTISLAPYVGELPDDADVLQTNAGPVATKRELVLAGGNGHGDIT